MSEPRPPVRAVPEGAGLVHLETCDSTNAEGMRLALAGASLPLWVVADRQTAGKGRSGRSWVSQDGNLLVSLVTNVAVPPARAPELSLVAGVAVIDAVRRAAASAPARLKWPNDILIGGAKLGGILVETTTIRGAMVAVIGIGLNLVTAPGGLGRAVTALGEHLPPGVRPAQPLEVLAFLAEAMHDWLRTWQLGFEPVRRAWLARAGEVGEALCVNAGSSVVTGRFVGLDDGGGLLLRLDAGETRRFTFGDVTLVPEN